MDERRPHGGRLRGGRAELRLPTHPLGRWELPGGIANVDGVVLACDFEEDELTYTHRPRSHEEYVTAEEVPADRLRVVAYIGKGANVFASLRARRQPPPLGATELAKVRTIARDAPLYCPGPLVAALRSAGAEDNDPEQNPWL